MTSYPFELPDSGCYFTLKSSGAGSSPARSEIGGLLDTTNVVTESADYYFHWARSSGAIVWGNSRAESWYFQGWQKAVIARSLLKAELVCQKRTER